MRIKGVYALAASLVLGSVMCGCVAPRDSVTVDVLNKPMWRWRGEEQLRYPPVAATGELPASAAHPSTNILYRFESVPAHEQELYLRRLEQQYNRPPTLEDRMHFPLRRDFPTEPRGIPIIRFRW